MEKIQKESESTCVYQRLFFDYTYGLDKIYTEAEIADARRSPSFEREYNLKYLGLIGNIFSIQDIEVAIEKGKNVDLLRINPYSAKSLGCDLGFGTTGICLTEWIDNQISIIYAEEFDKPDYNEMIDLIVQLVMKYNLTKGNSNIYIDGANNAFIRKLKEQLGENPRYDDEIENYKRSWKHNYSLQLLRQCMHVVPINFATEHKKMLAHTKEALEFNGGIVAIHPKFRKLITALRTAQEKGEYVLDKERTSYQHVLDAFRLALTFYN
jgi:hypothetical protein